MCSWVCCVRVCTRLQLSYTVLSDQFLADDVMLPFFLRMAPRSGAMARALVQLFPHMLGSFRGYSTIASMGAMCGLG